MVMKPIIWAALFCLTGLIYSEKRGFFIGRMVFKPLASTLFIVVAIMQNSSGSLYGYGILLGLALSWLGDLCLIFESDKLFLAGLIAFLGAHISYSGVFFSFGVWGSVSVFAGILLAGIGFIVYRWLNPNLGDMRRPVVGYMIVITIMLVTAIMLASSPETSPRGKWLVSGGATLFYLSDIWVARDRFVSPGFVNSAIGLPLYYTGQFFLAFSVGCF